MSALRVSVPLCEPCRSPAGGVVAMGRKVRTRGGIRGIT
ncbi:MAG: hypothetical protein AVDCRST_MAG68-5586 [uncultured Gemmatimonadetes bacterium]|uniref:Uncharacterized protein n=1 Tax=uncultured Gemmatimonadota bacterium TaxID=203437 RepID=A0A6J4MXI5_9BACT|nr:MAG: hypothetical protein AVDCRST_MAG68-5586 [uncultured Gemmatimonadota bacterium]